MPPRFLNDPGPDHASSQHSQEVARFPGGERKERRVVLRRRPRGLEYAPGVDAGSRRLRPRAGVGGATNDSIAEDPPVLRRRCGAVARKRHTLASPVQPGSTVTSRSVGHEILAILRVAATTGEARSLYLCTDEESRVRLRPGEELVTERLLQPRRLYEIVASLATVSFAKSPRPCLCAVFRWAIRAATQRQQQRQKACESGPVARASFALQVSLQRGGAASTGVFADHHRSPC